MFYFFKGNIFVGEWVRSLISSCKIKQKKQTRVKGETATSPGGWVV